MNGALQQNLQILSDLGAQAREGPGEPLEETGILIRALVQTVETGMACIPVYLCICLYSIASASLFICIYVLYDTCMCLWQCKSMSIHLQ